jgi:hypothetical protein
MLTERNNLEIYILSLSTIVPYYTKEKRGFKLARNSRKGIGADYDQIMK